MPVLLCSDSTEWPGPFPAFSAKHLHIQQWGKWQQRRQQQWRKWQREQKLAWRGAPAAKVRARSLCPEKRSLDGSLCNKSTIYWPWALFEIKRVVYFFHFIKIVQRFIDLCIILWNKVFRFKHNLMISSHWVRSVSAISSRFIWGKTFKI